MKDYLIRQYNEVKQSVADAASKAGRTPEEVKLVAVSKTFPMEDIQVLYEQGQRIFGENRIQELENKYLNMPDDIEWHFIGHVQSNKAMKAIQSSSYIHSVDSIKLLNRIDRLAGEAGKRVNFLLEFNISGEESKFGADDKTAMEIGEVAAKCKNIIFSGLMTMAPWGAEELELHNIFGGLRKLRDRMEEKFQVKLPELSMGMSGDYHVAIAEGATLVRIGTAIFGKRDYTV